jgi:DNA end-binding protein Ku
VSPLRARGRQQRAGQGLRVREGRYVVVEDEDIQKVRVESTRVIDLVQFTDDAAIDPIYVDRAYYLAPDGAIAASAFAVMREGMAGQGRDRQAGALRARVSDAVRPQKKGS